MIEEEDVSSKASNLDINQGMIAEDALRVIRYIVFKQIC